MDTEAKLIYQRKEVLFWVGLLLSMYQIFSADSVINTRVTYI